MIDIFQFIISVRLLFKKTANLSLWEDAGSLGGRGLLILRETVPKAAG
jgi:hypothetical protein